MLWSIAKKLVGTRIILATVVWLPHSFWRPSRGFAVNLNEKRSSRTEKWWINREVVFNSSSRGKEAKRLENYRRIIRLLFGVRLSKVLLTDENIFIAVPHHNQNRAAAQKRQTQDRSSKTGQSDFPVSTGLHPTEYQNQRCQLRAASPPLDPLTRFKRQGTTRCGLS